MSLEITLLFYSLKWSTVSKLIIASLSLKKKKSSVPYLFYAKLHRKVMKEIKLSHDSFVVNMNTLTVNTKVNVIQSIVVPH